MDSKDFYALISVLDKIANEFEAMNDQIDLLIKVIADLEKRHDELISAVTAIATDVRQY